MRVLLAPLLNETKEVRVLVEEFNCHLASLSDFVDDIYYRVHLFVECSELFHDIEETLKCFLCPLNLESVFNHDLPDQRSLKVLHLIKGGIQQSLEDSWQELERKLFVFVRDMCEHV